jgi:hypothetical protein
MDRRVVAITALLGLAAAGTSAASTVREASSLALPLELGVAPEPVVLAAVVPVAGHEFAPAPPGTRFESVRYRPRRRIYREPSYGPRPETFSQIHVGVMDVDGAERPGFLLGFRGGLAVDPNVQVGAQLDWRHRGSADTQVLSEQPGPGGTTITVRRDLSRSSSDLVPVMGLVQVGGGSGQVMPYFGLAGGLEVLHLSAQDFQTGEEFEGTFAGWGWQIWGGVAMPLSGRARVNAEAFYNAAELGRDVQDATTGQDLRETVDVSGAGARLGLAWGF